jgi:hypothetical protein
VTALRVGGASAAQDDATRFVRHYLNTPSARWAYPAYDGYPGGPTPDISAQDLFGPTLLNAGLRSLRSYYELLDALPELNRRLARIPRGADLADPSFDTTSVVEVIGLLDDVEIHGVRLTTLSKIIHRKRPAVFPLYDDHIRRCYQEIGDPPPVPVARGRSWRDFATTWIHAVGSDLSDQAESWSTLTRLTPTGGPAISSLRALDIVGWGLGQRNRRAWLKVTGA